MAPRRVAGGLPAVALLVAVLAGCGSGGGADSPNASPIVPDRAFGVFVGIAEYPLALPALDGCDEDAAAIWESLSGALPPWPQSAGSAAAQTRLLIWPLMAVTASGTRLPDGAVGAPSREGILMAIADLAARMTPRDLFVFYFSGHAEYDPGEARAYLYSSGPHEDRISDAELAAALAAVPRHGRAANVVVILDACEAGGFAEVAAAWAGVEVLASCGADEGSAVRGDYSVFTSALLQGLGRRNVIGPADANADGAITAGELFEHAQWATQQMIREQHPVFRGPDGLREMALKYRSAAP